MKRLFTILLLVFSVTSMMAGNNLLSLDSIIAGAYKPEKLPDFCPMQDPSLYSSLDETGTKLNSYVYQTGKLKETMLDLTKARGSKLKKIAGYSFNGQETKILIWEEERPIYRHSFLTEYYVYDRKRNLIEPLSEKGNQRDAKFSPDGRSIAFVRDNNLFIKRLDFGSELTVTTDGAMNRIINGAADWMYEEEAVMTAAYAWSPDSECLAYLKFNERSVPEYTFTLYGNDRMGGEAPVYYPGFRTYRYASAGDTISTVTVHVYQLKIRSSRKLSVPVDADGYIPRIRFTRSNNQLAVMTLNRNQNEFKLFFVNPKSG
ncbi:MAG: DPP IV N-terminal domain-containing protein, partial [Bacteroidota bacterium]|nr:DPP IV N-terminal domain-containing protein [Bacteroidota bacterium]